MKRGEALVEMLVMVENGAGVITGGRVHPDIPTGQEMCNRTSCEHAGYGMFTGMAPTSHRVIFDGGTAMRTAEADDVGDRFSWSPLTAESKTPTEMIRPTLESVGFDFQKVGDALVEMLEEYEGREVIEA